MPHAHVPVDTALQRAQLNHQHHYAELTTHGSMKLGMYTPVRHDPQQPHDQDEVYLVLRGSGVFVSGDERTEFGPGDALFVAAGVDHRFEDFSDDFATWVVFYGPTGGESDAGS